MLLVSCELQHEGCAIVTADATVTPAMGGSGPSHDEHQTHPDDVGPEQPLTRPVGKPLIDPTHALLDTQLSHVPDDDSVASLAEIGTEVGRYRVLGLLGRGGMGVVLHAHDPDLERELAIKLLREHVDAPDSPRGRALLMREARAIARVPHPNVIAVYDVGVHQGRVYVVMELVRGKALHVWMRDGHPLGLVLDVFAQAARGLSAAHAAGLVHRDFKPANVLVGGDGRVRVLDFGLARPPADVTAIHMAISTAPSIDLSKVESLTIAGTLAGTPAYMSPEQFESGNADARSDQFAFFVTLHEALFGTRPFNGDTLWELRDAVTSSPLALPGSADGLPGRMRELLHRGLAKHAADRFANMDAVVEVLDELHRELASSHDAPPIIAPLGYLAADSSTNRSLLSSERLSSYLGTLPRGLDSHPQCTMHGAALRFFLARHPLDDDELPEQVLASLATLARADPEDPWIAEVPARVLLAAIYDRHIRSLRTWDTLWFAIARSRFTRQFLGFTATGNGRALAGALAGLWNDFHRGSRLELTPTEDGLALVLGYPSELLDPLAHAEALQMVSAGLQLCGHDRVELRAIESDSRQLRAVICYR
jgi:serine/threonine protein kinase